MPGVMIERPKMTRTMYQALLRHIKRERENKKKEQEADEEMERLKIEREQKKKKEEEDSLTLEQTKDQIQQLEQRLESLKNEKHLLFSQLKKVLHQEDENRKRAQIKEQNEQQQYHTAAGIAAPSQPVYMQGHQQGRTQRYMNVSAHHPHSNMASGVKRSRTPSPPPPSSMFQHYPSSKFVPTTGYTVAKQDTYTTAKSSGYPSQTSTHVTYATQTGPVFPQQQHSAPQHQAPPSHQAQPTQHQTPPSQHQAPPPQQHPSNQHQVPPSQHQSQSSSTPHQPAASQHQQPTAGQHPAPIQHQAPPSQPLATPTQHQAPPGQQQQQQQQQGKYSGGQSAFQSYPSHYAHQQKQLPERSMQPGYQRLPQPGPGFMPSPHPSNSGLSLQQQLEHANQKSGFSEDKFKIQQSLRAMVPQQQTAIMAPGQIPASQAVTPAQPKGSIMTGYPVRTQASNPSFQPSTTQGAPSPHTNAPPRHQAYGGQGQSRYY